MENSIDCSAYVYSHMPPIFTGDTRGIQLAPYNVLYSSFPKALADAGVALVPEHVDAWAHPICCTLGSADQTMSARGTANLTDLDLANPNHSTYHFVNPATFQPIIVPEMQPSPQRSKELLCLPQVYNDALKTRDEEM